MICHKFSIHCVCKLLTENEETLKIATSLQFIVLVGQVMLHIPAKYQTRNIYGYGNFGIQNGRQAASLDRIDPFFLCTDGPYRDTDSYQIWPASLSHYENFPPKRFRLRRTPDGRKVNAIARWSFGPSVLKTR